MKNLTIKKIALGLFLAGYAASSAFALESTTIGTIKGTAPIMKAQGASAADHTMTVKIYEPNGTTLINRAAKVNDIISINWRLIDPDGDNDKAHNISKKFKIFTKDAEGKWVDKTADIRITDSAFDNANPEKGEFRFAIPASFAGARAIGYKIQERSDYGDPYEGQWLTVTDIWSNTKPGGHGGTEPTDPGTGNEGPGEGGNGSGPIETTTTNIGIFKFSGSTPQKGVNYAKAGAPDLKYGEQFVAIVWNDTNSNDIVEDGEGDITATYEFEWKLSGTYTPTAPVGSSTAPSAVNADTVPLTNDQGVDTYKGKNDRIYLGTKQSTEKHNTVYSSVHNAYLAGAQGYKLSVTAK